MPLRRRFGLLIYYVRGLGLTIAAESLASLICGILPEASYDTPLFASGREGSTPVDSNYASSDC